MISIHAVERIGDAGSGVLYAVACNIELSSAVVTGTELVIVPYNHDTEASAIAAVEQRYPAASPE